LRQNARLGDGEPIGLDAKLTHQGDVFAIAVIVVAGRIAGVVIDDMSGHLAIAVPNARSPPVNLARTFDLVTRCEAPQMKSRGRPRVGGLSATCKSSTSSWMVMFASPRLHADCDLEDAVALVGKQVVGFLDAIESEAMGYQRLEIDAAGSDDRHQAAHALLATGAE